MFYPLFFLFVFFIGFTHVYSSVCPTVPTTDGGCCVFPFKYHGKWHQSCTTTDNDGQLWCSKTSNYPADKQWGNCKFRDCEASTDHDNCCIFPFQYQKIWHDSCIQSNNEGKPWCSETFDYLTHQTWGNCVEPSPICPTIPTMDGGCCVFPFQYRGKWHHSCTTLNNNGELWCSKTSNYPVDQQWGNCKIKDCEVFTEDGSCCVFPFQYKENQYDSCIALDNDGKLWCSKTSNYDVDKKWGNCVKPDLICPTVPTTDGGCCVFPFLYHGEWYTSCTTVNNNGTPWCSKTSNYPSDTQWGNCQFEGPEE